MDFGNTATAFGFYTTGVQTVLTSLLTVTYNNGSQQEFDLPINVNGGASYFGFVDSLGFKSVTIADISDDAWGIDNVSFTSTVPEASTWAMLVAGFAGLGLLGRRAARRQVALSA